MDHVSINKKIKKVDRWVNYLVDHSHIKTAIFAVATLEALFLPLLPEILVAGALTYRKNLSWKLISFVSALGSTLGLSILYVLGRFLYARNEVYFDAFLQSGGYISTITQGVMQHSAFVVIFLSAFTPLPDRILAFISGVLSLPFLLVVPAFFFARLLRVGIVAYFSHRFGELARSYILRHSRIVVVALVVFVLLYVFFKAY